MDDLTEKFGSLVFNDRVMAERLDRHIYEELKEATKNGTSISRDVANAVAKAMKEWAIEKGATHFTHWFQPMTGVTAEKHDGFITKGEDGEVITEFSGKELIKGESDASSFPSGGIRSTFEARGYMAWDPTSCAFIKEKTLCIPSMFLSFSGAVLDKKTPLLRSCDALNKECLRVLKFFGMDDVTSVTPCVGAEQEYFLVDREVYRMRKDLVLTGRTLFGRRPPKGQELDDHYFGSIKPRVKAFMNDLDEELWKVGVLARTEHNEAAPAQHELAPVFTEINSATDQNQITMEIMKKTAMKHGMVCLLHEKPFKGINGSGKHNNWSIHTDTGINLLKPGKKPAENKLFLLFLCAVIRAVDKYQDLLRISVATAGNDHRLGANEAPPAIISVFLGEELTDILNSTVNGSMYEGKKNSMMELGVHAVPYLSKDNTDRNRTSPFAFTGNKFEFRMVGSSMSIAESNIVLNTIVSDSLCDFANALEKADDVDECVDELIRDTVKNHSRIIFNGNGYTEEWEKEAEERGLCNYKTCADALPHFMDEKNVELFSKFKIFTELEMRSRYEILLENYCKIINIEALTMVEMARKDILPAAMSYNRDICEELSGKLACVPEASCNAEEKMIVRMSSLTDALDEACDNTEDANREASLMENYLERAIACKEYVIPAMEHLRAVADEIEEYISSEYYPYPDYSDILFSIDN